MKDRESQLLADAVEQLSTDIRVLRSAILAESGHTTRQRRLVAFLLVTGVITAIQVHDQHIDHCGIGSRQHGEIRSPARDIAASQRPAVALICDTTFPLHNHGGGDQFPTPGNTVGLLGYLAVAGGGAIWVRRRGRHPYVNHAGSNTAELVGKVRRRIPEDG